MAKCVTRMYVYVGVRMNVPWYTYSRIFVCACFVCTRVCMCVCLCTVLRMG